MPLFRRTDIADRGFLSRSMRRFVQQAARDAGDGAIPATWGFIRGTISNQSDLKELTDDLEALAFLEGP